MGYSCGIKLRKQQLNSCRKNKHKKTKEKKKKTEEDEAQILSIQDNLERLKDSIKHENEVEELKSILQEKQKELDEMISELSTDNE